MERSCLTRRLVPRLCRIKRVSMRASLRAIAATLVAGIVGVLLPSLIGGGGRQALMRRVSGR